MRNARYESRRSVAGNTDVFSRRQFLSGVASVAAAVTLMAADRSIAQRAVTGNNLRLIDVHHHFLPPHYMAEARERVIAQGQGYLPAPVLAWTPENALAELDQNGVAAAIVSIST